MDIALLIVRVVVGAYLFGHGAQKAFGWFGGTGFAKTLQMMKHSLGHRPHWLWGTSLVLGEVVGGALMLLGLLSPLGPLAVAAAMIGATVQHWPKGIWGQKGGFELPLTNLAVALALALAGPGAYSLDTWLGIHLPLVVSEIAAVLLFGGVLASLLTRRQPEQQPQSAAA